jgi:hypothetical protein
MTKTYTELLPCRIHYVVLSTTTAVPFSKRDNPLPFVERLCRYNSCCVWITVACGPCGMPVQYARCNSCYSSTTSSLQFVTDWMTAVASSYMAFHLHDSGSETPLLACRRRRAGILYNLPARSITYAEPSDIASLPGFMFVSAWPIDSRELAPWYNIKIRPSSVELAPLSLSIPTQDKGHSQVLSPTNTKSPTFCRSSRCPLRKSFVRSRVSTISSNMAIPH